MRPAGYDSRGLNHRQMCWARAASRTVLQVDGREVDPSPAGLRAAVQGARGRHDLGHPNAELLAGDVLLVDDYDQLTPVDGWLREEFLPRLPADSVVRDREVFPLTMPVLPKIPRFDGCVPSCGICSIAARHSQYRSSTAGLVDRA